MLKGIQWFMERLVERVVPTVASSFMSTLQTMHVLGQAEQQDQIEEAARRYEAEGKTELAARLRHRSDELASETPGEQAVQMFEHFARDQQRLIPPERGSVKSPDSIELRRSSRRSTSSKRKRQTLPEPEKEGDTRHGT